jgi:23S rRNA pseudouridine1911/1915/1917 synthase
MEILFEDERLLVVGKPHGVFSVPAPEGNAQDLVGLLAEGGRRVLAVHRLDREVSGAILFAKDEATRAALEELFRAHALEKTYWALVAGTPRPPTGAWRFPIEKQGARALVSRRGKPAETRYRVLATLGAVSEVEIDLVTGRYNQIRLHFAHAGHPLVGERKYARGSAGALRANRLALHAWRIAFAHPWTGERMRVEAPLPEALERLRERAGAGRSRA